ncbi:hypothetical protein P9112_011666 [Eukaryota sp. TZLM1-RC]
MIKVNLKQMGKPQLTVETDPTVTVRQFKENIASQLNETDPSRIRLIFVGRVLKDDQTLSDSGIKEDCAVHVVRSSQPSQAPPPQTPATQPAGTPAQPQAPPRERAPPSMPFAMPGLDQLTQQMTSNPELMQQMMNSPMMESLMNNPEMMQQMMENNPMFRQLSEQNPEIASVLRDPDTMRQAMEMMRNPSAFRETMANQERTMSMLSHMPGGERAIRDAYESIEGLGSGMAPQAPRPSETAAETPAQPQQQEFPSLETPGGQQSRGDQQRGGFDASSMQSMFQSPAVQHMMSQMAGNPEQLQQMMSQNPFLAGSGVDPSMMGQMFSNPAVMAELQNPDTIAALMRLQNAMSQGQQSGQQPPSQAPSHGVPQVPQQPQLTVDQMLEQYKPQLDQMAEMGMCSSDEERRRCAELLHQCGGSLNMAIERYYSSM